ncbi:MAG: agmatine deiminase family protein [Anaerolineales bacterium]|nr:agmatine deiminase family protein [Anaerolineales bacterium]
MSLLTPKELGYRMPAEWEPHEGTWLIWPHEDTHKDSQLHLEHLWLEMTRVLQQFEVVHIIVPDQARREHLDHQIRYFGFSEKNLDIRIISNDDVWVRDCGPIFLVNDQGDLAVSTWDFNGWGERYPYLKDRNVAENVAKLSELDLFNAPLTLEGGGIEVNGQGSLIATRSSIINPNRNPGKDPAEIEQVVKEYLGVDNIIWLSGATREFCDAVGSDTDMHVDGCARFVDESTVMYLWTDDDTNPYYPYLKKHREELENAHLENGKKLTLVPLLKPNNKMYSTLVDTTRLPFENKTSLTTYLNFYIANEVVLVPVYGDVMDSTAKTIIAEHFPGRDIVGIPAWATAERGGMMHCVTQQQPESGKRE